jgi:aminomethyltransferase
MLKNIIGRTSNNLTRKAFSESNGHIKRTALYSFHKDNHKAKMVPFAGYEMPVQYFGIIEEHNHCRDNSSIFDVSHMGQVR